MICVYYPDETDFNNNGQSILTPTECTVTEELNGGFELVIKHPLDDMGRWMVINEFFIIKAPTPRGYQLFRIYKPVKTLNKTITAYARHITYDGLFNNTTAKAEGITSDAAIKMIYSNTCYPLDFIVSSDIDKMIDIEYTDVNPIYALMDESEGLVNKVEGELLRDNYKIEIKKSIGSDLGMQIRYRKNLTGLDFSADISNMATMVKPKALDGQRNDLLLPEVYIESPLISVYPFPVVQVLNCSDICVGEEYTIQSAQDEMRNRVTKLYEDGADKPELNAKVEFVNLGDTEEYKEYKQLEHVNLGDTITIIHEELDIDVCAKCVKYTYDCILQRYEKIEIGKVQNNIAKTLGGVDAAYSLASRVAYQNSLLDGRLSRLEKG